MLGSIIKIGAATCIAAGAGAVALIIKQHNEIRDCQDYMEMLEERIHELEDNKGPSIFKGTDSKPFPSFDPSFKFGEGTTLPGMDKMGRGCMGMGCMGMGGMGMGCMHMGGMKATMENQEKPTHAAEDTVSDGVKDTQAGTETKSEDEAQADGDIISSMTDVAAEMLEGAHHIVKTILESDTATSIKADVGRVLSKISENDTVKQVINTKTVNDFKGMAKEAHDKLHGAIADIAKAAEELASQVAKSEESGDEVPDTSKSDKEDTGKIDLGK